MRIKPERSRSSKIMNNESREPRSPDSRPHQNTITKLDQDQANPLKNTPTKSMITQIRSQNTLQTQLMKHEHKTMTSIIKHNTKIPNMIERQENIESKHANKIDKPSIKFILCEFPTLNLIDMIKFK